jgi:hypothetical protein
MEAWSLFRTSLRNERQAVLFAEELKNMRHRQGIPLFLDRGADMPDNLRFASGGVAEWLMAADCKSAL